jgi:gas vesicle protein
MGQDPSDIRAEIEETRARVGDEVDALSYKTDVPARVGDYVDDKKQAVKDKVSGVKDAITGTTSGAVHSTSNSLPNGQNLGKLKDTAERNPLGLMIGGVAVGFVTGLLLPSTRIEDRQMGEMSDRVIDAAKETAGDALESTKQVAQDAADSAKDQSQQLASSLQERAQESLAGSQTGYQAG